MKKQHLTVAFVVTAALLLPSCIQHETAEREWQIQADGRIFERLERLDLTSDAATTNKARKDFKELIGDIEPPITSPTPDPNIKGRIILRRELLKQAGTLNILEEAIYPEGLSTKVFSEAMSNGYLWVQFNTNDYDLECNGEMVGTCGEKGELLVRWPTNTTCIWFKRNRRSEAGFDLSGFYEAFLDAGRILPWSDDDEDEKPASGKDK